MVDNAYNIEYTKPSRAKCKLSTCKQPFDEGSLRIGKTFSSSNGERNQTDWYHVDCIFKAFVRARKTTKKIETIDDIQGFENLSPQDQDTVQKIVEDYSTNNIIKTTPSPPPPPKVHQNTTSNSTTTNSTTTNSTTTNSTTPNSTTPNPLTSSGGAPKRKAPESPNKPPVLKKQKKTKKGKEDYSEGVIEDDSEDVESYYDSDDDEEEEDHLGNEGGPLNGMIIATSGRLSLDRDEVIDLIESNGGKFSKSISKVVTHVVCQNSITLTPRLVKAKEEGKKIVGEDFLTRLQ